MEHLPVRPTAENIDSLESRWLESLGGLLYNLEDMLVMFGAIDLWLGIFAYFRLHEL